MYPSNDACHLAKLDSYTLREVCTYLNTKELINFWSTNDLRIHALLRRCDAFGLLNLTLDSEKDLPSILSWMKTLEKPRAKRFVFNLQDWPRLLFFRRLLTYCTFETVEFPYSQSKDKYFNLKSWQKHAISPDQVCTFLPGTTTLMISTQSGPTLLSSLPSTLTDLEMPGKWLSMLHPCNITSLTLTEELQLALHYDLALSPAPFILHELSTTLPNLTKLDVTASYEGEVLPIFEIPSSVTRLSFNSLHRDGVIFFWPPQLTHFELYPQYSDSLSSDLSMISRCVNFSTLNYYCPNLTYLEVPTAVVDTPVLAKEHWRTLAAHVGPNIVDRLIPPERASNGKFQPSNMDHSTGSPFIALLLRTLPSCFKTLVAAHETSNDLHATLAAINMAPLPHLSSLKLNANGVDQLIRLPSKITSLHLPYLYLSSEMARTLLPPSLTLLEAVFVNLDDLIAARKVVGPRTRIECSLISHSGVSSAHVALLFLPPTGDPTKSSMDDESRTETGNDASKPLSRFPGIDDRSLGPYGSNNIYDANGNWTVTLSGLKNALGRLIGQNTAVHLTFNETLQWPSNIVKFLLPEGERHDNGPIHLGINGFNYPPHGACIHLETYSRLPSVLPSSLTILKSHSPYIVQEDSYWTSAPRLTHLELPKTHLSLNALLLLPIGIRFLSIGFQQIQDHELHDALKQLPFLETAKLKADEIIFTAPNWPSTSLTLAGIHSWLETYLKPKANVIIKILPQKTQLIKVSFNLLPRDLTALNLLGAPFFTDLSELPSGIIDFNGDVNPEALKTLLSTCPSLQTLTTHFPHSHITLPVLPASLRSLCITTRNKINIRPSSTAFEMMNSILPCAASLHTLVVPEANLQDLLSHRKEKSSEAILPSLTRLIIGDQELSDVKLHQILQSNFPKLTRLTVTSYVHFTGRLVSESSSSTTSFQSMFHDTRTVLRSVLESRYRKFINIQRSSNPSQLERLEKSTQLSDDLSVADMSSIEPTSLIQDTDDALRPDVNIFFTLPPIHDKLPTLILPSDATHLSLLLSRSREPFEKLSTGLSSMETPLADWIESEAKSTTYFVAPSKFCWTTIDNSVDLHHLVSIEYESKVPYKPGEFFLYSTLKQLKIFAPIATINDDSDDFKYAQWTLPKSLTHLTASMAFISFDFVHADGDKVSQLLTLELPNAIWQGEHAVPSSIRKLVIMDVNPCTISDDLKSRGCEIVLI